MNGPEHYREAERLLSTAYEGTLTTHEGYNPEADRSIAEAHVHAMLAMTAAYALTQPICESPNDSSGHPSQEFYDEWVGVVECGGPDYEGVAFGGTTDPSIVSQQNAENAL